MGRVVDRGDEERQALLLPARELAEAPGRFVAQVDFGQAGKDRRLGKRYSVQAGVQLDDLADRQLGLKARGLELNAEQRFGRPGVGSSVDLADQDRPRGLLEQSLDGAQGACLAGSVGTQKTEDLAFVDVERDPIHRSLGAVADTQVFDLESKTGHRRRFSCHSVFTQGIPLTAGAGCGGPLGKDHPSPSEKPTPTLPQLSSIFVRPSLLSSGVAIDLYAQVGLTLLVLATVMGFSWIALWIIELFLAIGQSEMRWRPWIGITGILSIVAGAVVVIFPVSSLFFLTIFLGFWLVIFGVTLIVRGFGLRSAARAMKPMATSPAA